MTSRELRLLHGSAAELQRMTPLRAGDLTMFLDGVDLRYISAGGVELVRRVYAAVRDASWNTIEGEVTGLELDNRGDAFEVRLTSRHRVADGEFAWHGSIVGSGEGTVEYRLDGEAKSDLSFNRIGLCVHHPWHETAGARFRAQTPEGTYEGSFPDLIGPQRFDGTYHPLFPSYETLEIELSEGGSVLLEFDGDLWEVEDQRNWTDASFKSYSTPISLPIPHELPAGAALRQSLRIRARDVPHRSATAGAIRLTIGDTPVGRMPAVGLGADRDHHLLSEQEARLVALARPAHLRVEVRPDRREWRTELAIAQANARSVGAHLEVSLHLRASDAAMLAELADQLTAGPAIDRMLVVSADGRVASPEETTAPELVDLVREHVPGIPIVGGTEMYFAELNRTRPRTDGWDGVCFSICPQIHAFTDVDIVENLDAQAEAVRSARALAPGVPVIVSPVTLRRRHNFHGAVLDPDPEPGQLPDSVDPRQASLLGAAWTAASVKYLAEAGAASITYYETSGWRGILERPAGTSLLEQFHSDPGHVFPLFHVLADVAGWRDAELLPVESSDPRKIVGLAARGMHGFDVLLASLSSETCDVVVNWRARLQRIRRLGLETVEQACRGPELFRTLAERPQSGARELRIGPFETVRVETS
jgi:hypothetical protein